MGDIMFQVLKGADANFQQDICAIEKGGIEGGGGNTKLHFLSEVNQKFVVKPDFASIINNYDNSNTTNANTVSN